MLWSLFRVFTGSGTFRRNMVILESFGAFGGAKLHRRVRCLAMDGDLPTCHRSQVNQHLVAEVMPVLLKSGQSASQEEAAEKRKPCRSMQHSARRSMEIPDRGPSIVDGYAFYTLSFLLFLLGEKEELLSECSWNSIGFLNHFYFSFTSISSMIFKTMKKGFLDPSRKESAGLCTIRKPKREVSIDTLQATSIDSVSQASNDTIHRGTIHPGTVHHVTVHPGTVHCNTIHRDTIHRDTIYLPSIDTVHPVSVDTIHVPSIDTVHPVSVDTIYIPSIDTVHPVSVDTIHVPSIDTVHLVSVDTVNISSIDTVHILSLDTVHPNTVHPNTVHYDTVHPNTVHQSTIHHGTVPPMTNTTYGETEKVEALIFKIDKKVNGMTGGSEDPFYGLPHEDPKDLIKKLEEDAFRWFSKLQPRSLTCWEDIKEAFIGKFFSEAVATQSKRLDYMIKEREKGIMISMSQILDFIYSEENGDIGTPTTHVKQPNIQVHHADEREQSKVEEADTKDPTSASIDSSNSESIGICTSETIDKNICHRSIPSTIPDATTVSASRRSALQNTVLELHPAYISLVGQHSFHGFPHEDPTSHLETFIDLASTIKCNGVPEDYYLCKLFPYSLDGDATHWLKKLPPGSLNAWNDIANAFVNKFLYDAAASLEIEIRSMMEYMVEDDEQHELRTDRYSNLNIDRHPNRNIDRPQPSNIDRHKLLLSIELKSIDVSSYYPDQKVEKEITMEYFLEVEAFLELEDGQQLGDLDSSEEVTMEDFLELEEWLGDLDQNPKQKFDDQHTSGRGLKISPKANDIDRHQPDEIDRYTPCIIDQHPPDSIDRHPCLDELSGYPIEPGPIEEIMHMSKTSHIDIMVPCAVFEVESPIPPDKGVYLSSYIEVLNDQHHVEASQRGLRFRIEVDEVPAEAPSSDMSKSELIDTNTSSSIDTDQIPSIDTRCESEQNEYELCGNIFYGDTTTHSDKSGGKKKSRVRLHKSVGKKGRNWKKRKRTKGGSQLLLTPYFTDSIRKPRVHSRCFSQPFAKLKALLITEMIYKGEGKRTRSKEDEIAGDSMMATTSTDDTSSVSIDSASYPTIDFLFIVSNDCSSHRPMRPCHYQSTALHQHRSIVYSLCPIDIDVEQIVLKILKWINLSTMFTLAEIRDCPSVLLEDKQNGLGTFRRNMVILESFGAFGGAELHKRVICLAMDGDLPTVRLSPYFDTRYSFELGFQFYRSQVNQHLVAEVMPVLLKSGQSASREEAAEKRKPCRSMQHSARRSMEISDRGPSIVDGYAFYTLSFPLFLLGEKGGTPIRLLL
ncbi:hypothetical protein IGI04_042397 [Brassica rapa subsp. trilocularis]|uniref:Retrotransposon gag domain-containing protein n=1 Tax=Brassica rapa subsp. trilocularis TaxID=1813537 RepID=A0ABQ7KJH3_BRACM|nr:hypothetical protein IGI04_042397 [Brassica rapa subsp. trilocularis]